MAALFLENLVFLVSTLTGSSFKIALLKFFVCLFFFLFLLPFFRREVKLMKNDQEGIAVHVRTATDNGICT